MSGIASNATVLKVLGVATSVAHNSWEYGTVSQALLDWHDPDLSIWNNPFPNGNAVPQLNSDEVEALRYIKPFIDTNGETLIEAAGMLQQTLFVEYKIQPLDGKSLTSI
jgi:hypothetical protein